MKFYVLLAFLPCILAADFRNIQCPDGSLCPVGKTCCKSSAGSFECCDLAEEEQQNKKLVPSFFSSSISGNVSHTTCQYGTFCGPDFCCEYDYATCCSPVSCCPSGHRCCGSSNFNLWCCKTNQRCAFTYMYCIAGAASLTPGFIVMILITILSVAYKRF